MKIITLKDEEVLLLRNSLEDEFARKGITLKKNAYLGNYEELSKDIIGKIKNHKEDCSAGRLRKLFYYTNSDLCTEDQIQPKSFNVNFLNALYLYISNNEYNRTEYLKNKNGFKSKIRHKIDSNLFPKTNLLWLLPVLFLLPVIIWFFSHNTPENINYSQEAIDSLISNEEFLEFAISPESIISFQFEQGNTENPIDLTLIQDKGSKLTLEFEYKSAKNYLLTIENYCNQRILWRKSFIVTEYFKLYYSNDFLIFSDTDYRWIEDVPIVKPIQKMVIKKSKNGTKLNMSNLSIEYLK